MYSHKIVTDTRHLQELSYQLTEFTFDYSKLRQIKTGLNKDGLSYLQQAAYNGDAYLVLHLLNVGVDIDACLEPDADEPTDNKKHFKTALYLAVENNHHLIANILLIHGADKTRAAALATKNQNAKLNEQLNALTIDTDIQRGVILWRIAHYNKKYSEKLHETLIPSIRITAQDDEKKPATLDIKLADEKTTIDTSTDTKQIENVKPSTNPITIADINGWTELAAFRHKSRNSHGDLISSLTRHGETRATPHIRTALYWNIYNTLYNRCDKVRALIPASPEASQTLATTTFFQLDESLLFNDKDLRKNILEELTEGGAQSDYKAAYGAYLKESIDRKNFNPIYKSAANRVLDTDLIPDVEDVLAAIQTAIELKNYVALNQLLAYPYHEKILFHAVENNNRALFSIIILHSTLFITKFMHSLLPKPELLNRFVDLYGGIESIINHFINKHIHLVDTDISREENALLNYFKINHETLFLDLTLKSLHFRNPESDLLARLVAQPGTELNQRTDNWKCTHNTNNLIANKLSQFNFKQTTYSNIVIHIDNASVNRLQQIPKEIIKYRVLSYLTETELSALALTSTKYYQLCAPPKKLMYADELQATAKSLYALIDKEFMARGLIDNLRDRNQPNNRRMKHSAYCLVMAIVLFVPGIYLQKAKEEKTTSISLLTFGSIFLCCLICCLRSGLKAYQSDSLRYLTVASLTPSTQEIARRMLELAADIEPAKVPLFSQDISLINLHEHVNRYANERLLVPSSALVNNLALAEEKWGKLTLEKASPKAQSSASKAPTLFSTTDAKAITVQDVKAEPKIETETPKDKVGDKKAAASDIVITVIPDTNIENPIENPDGLLNLFKKK